MIENDIPPKTRKKILELLEAIEALLFLTKKILIKVEKDIKIGNIKVRKN